MMCTLLHWALKRLSSYRGRRSSPTVHLKGHVESEIKHSPPPSVFGSTSFVQYTLGDTCTSAWHGCVCVRTGGVHAGRWNKISLPFRIASAQRPTTRLRSSSSHTFSWKVGQDVFVQTDLVSWRNKSSGPKRHEPKQTHSEVSQDSDPKSTGRLGRPVHTT
jgi:hypothetical protein